MFLRTWQKWSAFGALALAGLFGGGLASISSGCFLEVNGIATGGSTSSSSTSSSSTSSISSSSTGGTGGASSSSTGSGGCTTADDCGALPACATWTCVAHACALKPADPGSTCSGGVCDVTGTCVTCITTPVQAGCTATQYCAAGACASCTDTAANGDETDVDCGGTHCPACAVGQKCSHDVDCTSMTCDTSVTPAVCGGCADGKKNGQETDTDCGGPACSKCAVGKKCAQGSDCTSAQCNKGICTECNDGKKDGDETDVDCGGSCTQGCANANACKVDGDCTGGHCAGGVCCDAGCKDACSSCALPGVVGTCTQYPPSEVSPTCNGANACFFNVCQDLQGKKPLGATCGNFMECGNGYCVAGYCKLRAGAPCTRDVECGANRCVQNKCAYCVNDGQCASGKCDTVHNFCVQVEGSSCIADYECLGGSCKGGICTQQHAVGQSCLSASDCSTFLCTNGTCASCTTADCASCSAGKCLAPSGTPCQNGSFCDSGQCVGAAPYQNCQ